MMMMMMCVCVYMYVCVNSEHLNPSAPSDNRQNGAEVRLTLDDAAASASSPDKSLVLNYFFCVCLLLSY